MKVLLILLSVVVVVFGQEELEFAASLGINEQLAQAIENLKKQMPCGFPDQGVPPLAPFKKEYVELQYKHTLFGFLGNFFDLRVDGLDNFRNDEVTFSIFTLKGTFDFNFYKILATGDYMLNFFPFNKFKITGKGKLNFALEDLRIKGSFRLGLIGNGLALTELDVAVVLGDCKSNIDGLLGGGFLGRTANRAIETFVKLFIKTQSKFITKTIHNTIVPKVNEKLQKLTIKDILDLINSSQKPSTCVPPPDYKVMQLLDVIDLLDE